MALIWSNLEEHLKVNNVIGVGETSVVVGLLFSIIRVLGVCVVLNDKL